MPFAIFRRNQKKLIAIFGILAMISFVVADTLPRLLSSNSGPGADPEVAILYGKTIRRGDLMGMARERYFANTFLAALSQRELLPRIGPQPFGDTGDAAIVDALILRHEADALGIPATNESALRWLATMTHDRMTAPIAEAIVREHFRSQGASSEQVLGAIADQLRLQEVSRLPGLPEVTPLDVFRTFRDQNEKVSVNALPVRVADYVAEVPHPSTTALRAFHDQFKDALPDPASPTPGFRVPRRIRLEYLAFNLAARETQLRAKLTEAEVRDAYEERKGELSRSSPSQFDELPVDLFAGDPLAELTPRLFEDVRHELETELARAQANAEMVRKFEKARDVMADHQAKVEEILHPTDAEDSAASSSATSATARPVLPTPPDLKALAVEQGLDYESTPMLTLAAAEKYGDLGRGHAGLPGSGGQGHTFASEAFDPKNGLFFPLELSDEAHAFLAWKVEDQASYTPTLEEIRKDVEAAWKREQARPLALKAAQAIAEDARKVDGDLNKVGPRDRVLTTEPISRLQRATMPGQPPRPTEIPQIPDAGEDLREALFGLAPKAVVVQPDKTLSTYYVLALNARIDSTFQDLYTPFNGDRQYLEMWTFGEALNRRKETWMASLRAKAGLKPDWAPPEESRRKSRSRTDFDE